MLTHHGKTFVVKIGSAALCQPDGALDETLIAALLHDIAAAKRAGAFVVLVTSGAVALGKQVCGGEDRSTRGKQHKIFASVGQPLLMNLYSHLLSRHGLHAGQILLNQQDIHAPQDLCATLEDLKSHPQILPIINENDAVATPAFAEKLAFNDNDELAGELAEMLNADRLIILSNVAGVFGEDGRVIASIDPDDDHRLIGDILGKASQKSNTGRGGMKTKLTAAVSAARNGTSVHIASSREQRVLARIFNDEKIGTVIESAIQTRQPVTGGTYEHDSL